MVRLASPSSYRAVVESSSYQVAAGYYRNFGGNSLDPPRRYNYRSFHMDIPYPVVVVVGPYPVVEEEELSFQVEEVSSSYPVVVESSYPAEPYPVVEVAAAAEVAAESSSLVEGYDPRTDRDRYYSCCCLTF